MTKEERKKIKKDTEKLFVIRKINISNHISAILGSSPFAVYENEIEWNKVSIGFKSSFINEKQQQIYVDPKGMDEKTYFALVGLAHSYDFELNDTEFSDD